MYGKKIVSLILALCMLIPAAFSCGVFAAENDMAEISAAVEYAEVSKDYGLAKKIQDGNILHCFNWKYNDIKAELKNIAEAGFTSVQTSPAQPAGGGEWYWLYQPYGFYVGNNSLGSKSDLQSLCQEADKYGIKVVVDVVANHLNGETHRVQSDLQDGQYWHTLGGVSNWADRYQVTHGEIGMRDLNSEHSYVQQVVANYMKELEGIGVDGIRWDAAKHISLPSEGCNFWPAVTKNNNMWHYGEILVGPDDRGSGNEGLMIEYTNYMTVTDSSYGMTLRNSFAGGSVPSSYGNWCNRGVADNKLIYWGESHDTWSNGQDWGYSNGMSQNVIDRAYAVAASRSGANALYFSRPGTADKSGIRSGQKGSTAFKNSEVAAVNQLKNACVGEKDYYVTGNNCAAVCRESGAVVVTGSGGNYSVSISNGGGTTKPGTYKDLVSGNTWTVTSSTISGQVGSSGIAVLLNAKPAGPSASVTPGTQSYRTDTLTLTLNYENATSGQYSVDGSSYKNFSNGEKITIGSGVSYGTVTTVSVKASNSSQTSDVTTYKYTKVDPTATGIYFDNSSVKWGTVYCYIYKDGSNAPAQWPGTKMTKESGNIWSYTPPSGYSNCWVLFTDGNGNQIPGANEQGLEYNGSPMIYKDNSWQSYAPAPKPTTATTAPTQATTQATQTTATDPAEETRYLYGDVDFDTKISIKDATHIQKYCANLVTMSALQKAVAKVTGKDVVSIADATAIQKMASGIIDVFASGKWYYTSGEYPDVYPEQTDPVETTTTRATVATTAATKPVSSDKRTVYFKNTNGWGGVTAYVWSTSGGELTGWPGTQMTYVKDSVYKIELEKKYDMIIFSDNGSAQSGDLTIPGDGYIFNYAENKWYDYDNSGNSGGNSGNSGNNSGGNVSGNVTIKFVDTNNWGSAKVICWKNGSSSQEYNMQSIGNNTYTVSIPASYDKLYFTNGNQKSQDFDFPKNGGTYTYNHGWS